MRRCSQALRIFVREENCILLLEISQVFSPHPPVFFSLFLQPNISNVWGELNCLTTCGFARVVMTERRGLWLVLDCALLILLLLADKHCLLNTVGWYYCCCVHL